ncbi:MAG: ASKHA domain-containing protein [bacterium]
MTPRRRINIKFNPSGRIVRVPVGCTVLEAVWGCGAAIDSPCGGHGVCGKCRVTVSGRLSPLTAQEKQHLSAAEIRGGTRLACQTSIVSAAEITIPPSAIDYVRPPDRLQDAGFRRLKTRKIHLSPRTKKIYLALHPPTLRDQRPDAQRLLDCLTLALNPKLHKTKLPHAALHIPHPCMPLPLYRKLPALLRTSNYNITAVLCGSRLIGVEPGDTTDNLTGAAIDVGTTTVSVRLYDLVSGALLAEQLMLNPQGRCGGDVAARLTFAAENTDGTAILQRLIVRQLNGMLAAAAGKAGKKVGEIYDITVVGNSTMMHLLTGVNPQYLAYAPFVPCFSDGLELKAREVGLKVHPEGGLRILPCVSAYIGADAVGASLSSGLAGARKPTLLIDMGTNAEILLSTGEGITACSAAAGPALEGAQISCGTHAQAGAIQHIMVQCAKCKVQNSKLKTRNSQLATRNSEFCYSTIGGAPPVGLCGCALFDLIAELLRAGAINSGGFLAADGVLPDYSFIRKRIRKRAGQNMFRIVDAKESAAGSGLFLMQRDIRQFQLAKSAILTGIKTLLEKNGVRIDEIDRIYLAGLLGTSLNAESAIASGVLPSVDTSRVHYIGNAAIDGAAMVLLCEPHWQKTKKIAAGTNYIELSHLKMFQNAFIKNLRFP